jgi:hypothetical protein
MRKAHAERDIRVSGPDDVRYPEGIALDPSVILSSFDNQAGRIRRRRLAQPVGHYQEYGGSKQYQRKCESADLHIAHECPLPTNITATDKSVKRVKVKVSDAVRGGETIETLPPILSRRTFLLGAAFPSGAQEATFSTDVQVVSLLAMVHDNDGRVVKDLNKEDFLLQEDEKPRTVSYLSRAGVLEQERSRQLYIFFPGAARESRPGVSFRGTAIEFAQRADTIVYAIRCFGHKPVLSAWQGNRGNRFRRGQTCTGTDGGRNRRSGIPSV